MKHSTSLTALALSGLLAAAPGFVAPGFAQTQSTGSQSGTMRSDSTQSGTAQAGNTQSGTMQSGTMQSDNAQADSTQSGTMQSDNAQSGNMQADSNQSQNDSANMQNHVVMTARDASAALRDIQMARFAIFDGMPDKATQYVNDAQSSLKKAASQAKNYQMKPENASDQSEMYLPVDGNMVIAAGYVPSSDNQSAMDKANKNLGQGNSKASVQDLKLANIGVTIAVAMMPQKSAMSNLDDAASLLGNGKYYEASSKLKAIEDSIVVQTYDGNSMPKQGSASN